MSDNDLNPYEIEITVSGPSTTHTIYGEISSEATTPQQITESVEHVLSEHYGAKRFRAIDPAR